MITLISPKLNSEISILTPIQKEFIRRERPMKTPPETRDEDNAYPWLPRNTVECFNQSASASVIFKWKISDIYAPMNFEISVNEDFSPDNLPCSAATVGLIFADASEEFVYSVKVDNLLSGTKYYWRVTVGEESAVGSFSTVYGEFRPMRVGDMINVRDMGGRVNAEGRRIKQGLVYRGGEFDDINNPEHVSFGAAKVIKEDMRLKTDIDLRIEAAHNKFTKSFAGDNVNYQLIPFDAYGATLNDVGRANLRKILEIFADEENYPVYFHCAVGADRTGTIGMYLDAILGMSSEDIILNYNFTSLAGELIRSWYHTSDCIGLWEYLEEIMPDKTVAERLMANLKKSGITDETLDKIRNILLEK